MIESRSFFKHYFPSLYFLFYFGQVSRLCDYPLCHSLFPLCLTASPPSVYMNTCLPSLTARVSSLHPCLSPCSFSVLLLFFFPFAHLAVRCCTSRPAYMSHSSTLKRITCSRLTGTSRFISVIDFTSNHQQSLCALIHPAHMDIALCHFLLMSSFISSVCVWGRGGGSGSIFACM